MKCLLGIDPKKEKECSLRKCATCGWEETEAARRAAHLKEHGLTLCADGLRRLVMPEDKKTE